MSKKYHNPIAKVETVTIPTWEYADLIKASTIAAMTKKLLNGMGEYQVRDALKVLYGKTKEEDN
jgi:hypothetical protein